MEQEEEDDSDEVVLGRRSQFLKGTGASGARAFVQLGSKRDLLHPGGADVVVFKPRRHVIFIIHQRVDDGVGERMVHAVDHAVRPA